MRGEERGEVVVSVASAAHRRLCEVLAREWHGRVLAGNGYEVGELLQRHALGPPAAQPRPRRQPRREARALDDILEGGLALEAIDEGNADGDLEVLQILLWQAVDGLDDRADGIGVRHHEHRLAAPQVWQDLLPPHRQTPLDGILHRLAVGDGHRPHDAAAVVPAPVARVAARVARVRRIEGRRP